MPEILDGKETGRLTTTGTFIKTEKQFTVSFTDSKGNLVQTKTFATESAANNYADGFNYDNEYNQNITSEIIQTDLGKTINPNNL